jgi:hypothetical protein
MTLRLVAVLERAMIQLDDPTEARS